MGKLKCLLISLILFTLTIFLVEPTIAQEYFFQEEFNQERVNNTLDNTKWVVYPNTLTNFPTIKETAGRLETKQQTFKTQYPLIVSKNVIFPSGDFSSEVKFNYTNITFWGTGIAFAEQAPTNGGGFNPLLTIGVWQDLTLTNMRIGFNGVDVFTTPINTSNHSLKVDRVGQKYLIYLDNNLIYTSPNISKQIKYIWMGNPTVQTPIPAWSSFNVDYIRVTQNFPEPFLELPWDYQSQGRSFGQEIFRPFSWFDHQYPLQNECCDSPVLNYTGELKNLFYRSHSGYDYSANNGVKFNTPVLAAASGIATFIPESNSGGAGNMIKIDHGNSYQTWYEHLDTKELVVSQEGQSINVAKGQKIGLVGMSGNTTGPHIHLSVLKDENNSGSFNDDYPFGLVDPLGWEGESVDPWELYSSGGRHGAKSYKLFTGLAPPQIVNIPQTGGNFITDKTTVNVPNGATNSAFDLIFKNGPFEKASDLVTSIAPSFFLNAFNILGNPITQFNSPIQIIYNYSGADLANIDENSLKLYSFNSQANQWEELVGVLDKINKTLTSQSSHFSQFAIMGTIKDLIPPQTEVQVIGDKGNNNWYRSDVAVELLGLDNFEGIGLEYTLFTLDGENWQEYKDPLEFTQEGMHKITYLSIDKADNREEIKTFEFQVDKTIPEAKIYIDQDLQDLIISGIDQNQTTVNKLLNPNSDKKDDALYEIIDLAGNSLKLDVRDRDKEKDDKFSIYSLKYNSNSEVIQPKNYYNVKYETKKDKFNLEDQSFEIDGEVKIRIKYDNKKNQSSIFLKEDNGEKLKEIKDGLILLQLQTNQGNLEYSY